MENEFIKDVELEEEEVAPANETKEEKFKRISGQRIRKATKYINNLGSLANKNTYEYTEEDIEKIFSYLQKQLDDARAKFDATNKKNDEFSW